MGVFRRRGFVVGSNNPTGGKSTGFFHKGLFGEKPEGVISGRDRVYDETITPMDTTVARDNKELYVAHTTTYQNLKGYTLFVEYIPTGLHITFKGMLTEFKDNHISEWQTESVYGRMDDIHTFRNTKRSMDIGFVVPAFDAEDARCNLAKVNALTKKLYPTYTGDSTNVSNISQAPLLRIRFANLIRDGRLSNESGLLGKTDGFSFAPVLEDGFFDYPGLLYPKTINIQFKFDVLHEHVVGWTDADDGGYDFSSGQAPGFPHTHGFDKLPSNTIDFPTVLARPDEPQLDEGMVPSEEFQKYSEDLAAYDANVLELSSFSSGR